MERNSQEEGDSMNRVLMVMMITIFLLAFVGCGQRAAQRTIPPAPVAEPQPAAEEPTTAVAEDLERESAEIDENLQELETLEDELNFDDLEGLDDDLNFEDI